MQSKRIGFLTPYFSQSRGNATTAKRLENGLSGAGFTVEIFAYEEETWRDDVRRRLEACELLHILHFERFISWKKNIKDFPNTPYIVTAGGTDLYESSGNFSLIHAFLQGANKVVVFSKEGKERIELVFQLKPDQITIIPQSVWFPSERESSEKPNIEGDPKLLLPAGLRPVKDVLYLLEPLKALQKKVYPSLKFVILGPVLDQDVYKDVMKEVSDHEWFIYKAAVPLSEVPNWYNWADVVLNSSLSEGQSSALLEAMALGVPVLARKIPGNEGVIKDLENGLLFADEADFTEKLKRLLSNPNLRDHVIQKGKEAVDHEHSLKKEIADYTRIYEQAHITPVI